MATEMARTVDPEGLVKKHICPIKEQYVLQSAERRVHVEALGAGGTKESAPSEQKAKSRKQVKRDKKEDHKSKLCFHYIRGLCTFGESCRFSHNMEVYLKGRPSDLPGRCPFSSQPCCPYVVACRWASTHEKPCALTKELLLDRSHPQPLREQDDSSIVKLPVASEIVKPRNELPSAIQLDLRKRKYDFSKAKGVLESLGVLNTRKDTGGAGSASAKAGNKAAGKGKRGPVPEPGKGGSAVPDAEEAAPRGANGEEKLEAGAGGGAHAQQPGSLAQSSDKAEQPAAGTTTADTGAAAEDAIASVPAQTNGGTATASGEAHRPSVQPQDPASAPQGAAAGDRGPAPMETDGSASVPTAPADDDSQAAKTQSSEVSARKRPLDMAASEGLVPVYDVSKCSRVDSVALGREEPRKLDLRGKLYCAPLTTAGNLPFRRVVKGYGCDVTCGEMAMATNLLQGQQSEWALLKRHACEDFFGVQICASYPDMATHCVQLLNDQIDVDFIDINMGCPIDLVCDAGAGAALLQRPKKLESIVRAAATVSTCPVTFKTRTGYLDRENQRVAHRILPQAAEWGAAAVTLHGRTRQQRYSREADWAYIKATAEEAPSSLQVIGNGDVFSWEDYHRHMEGSKLATCMIARGALIKPWIFTEIKEKRHWDISATERFDMLKDYCKFGLEHWGSDDKGVENTRRFLLEWLSYLHRYVPVGLLEVLPQKMTWRPPNYRGRDELETLLASSSAADWIKISERLLGPVPDGFVFAPKHKSNAYIVTEHDVGAAYS